MIERTPSACRHLPRRWTARVIAVSWRRADLPPCGGDVRQAEGGVRRIRCLSLDLHRLPRLRRQNRRPVPRLARNRPLARSQGAAASRKQTFDAAFAGVTPNLEAARPGHARRKAEDAEEAASGRVRLARQLFRREDHRRGQRRAGAPAPASMPGRLRRSRSATACRASIVLAIWGRESGFGAAKIPYDAFEVLGTKAFLADPQGHVPHRGARGAR